MFSAQALTNYKFLAWPDILWAYSRGLIGWRTAADLASRKSDPIYQETELAWVGKDETWRVRDILEELSALNPVSEALSKKKWLFLTLLKLYEVSNPSDDECAERLWSIFVDFDYPEELRPFMPYYSVDDGYDPSAHSKEDNRRRMFELWKQYLDKSGAELATLPKTPSDPDD